MLLLRLWGQNHLFHVSTDMFNFTGKMKECITRSVRALDMKRNPMAESCHFLKRYSILHGYTGGPSCCLGAVHLWSGGRASGKEFGFDNVFLWQYVVQYFPPKGVSPSHYTLLFTPDWDKQPTCGVSFSFHCKKLVFNLHTTSKSKCLGSCFVSFWGEVSRELFFLQFCPSPPLDQ